MWLESPTNPALEVADIPTITAAAHEAGASVVVAADLLALTLLEAPGNDGVSSTAMVASRLCTSWCAAIGLPNWTRSRA